MAINFCYIVIVNTQPLVTKQWSGKIVGDQKGKEVIKSDKKVITGDDEKQGLIFINIKYKLL